MLLCYHERIMDIREEKLLDNQYGINTCGRDDSREDNEHRAYEPTPYDVLELIAESGFIESADTLVDMGCGKGRASLFLANKTHCKAIGIEYDDRLVLLAKENLENMPNHSDVIFLHESAENYAISADDTVFFFFNPFSEKILETVLSNIQKSYYESPRNIRLLFYYPSLEYVGRLMTKDYLNFVDEIDCSHLYKDNKGRECVMIFEVAIE